MGSINFHPFYCEIKLTILSFVSLLTVPIFVSLKRNHIISLTYHLNLHTMTPYHLHAEFELYYQVPLFACKTTRPSFTDSTVAFVAVCTNTPWPFFETLASPFRKQELHNLFAEYSLLFLIRRIEHERFSKLFFVPFRYSSKLKFFFHHFFCNSFRTVKEEGAFLYKIATERTNIADNNTLKKNTSFRNKG